MRHEYASGTLARERSGPANILSLFGPRGGTAFVGEISAASARNLARQLNDTADKLEQPPC